MVLAKIIDNQPYCPCGCIVGRGTGEYRQVIDKDGKQYTEFVKYCSNPKCHNKIIYQVEIFMGEHKRYALEDVTLYKMELQGIPLALADGWDCRIKEDKIL